MKRIVRELQVSRNTVRKILRSDEADFSYERERQPMPRFGPWQGQLEQFLSGNAGKSCRDRLTLIQIIEDLRRIGAQRCAFHISSTHARRQRCQLSQAPLDEGIRLGRGGSARNEAGWRS
ncbi:hypothetical protein C5F44_14950 [Fuscovulum blasticum DSM 2131]|uniref:HTH IS21-type domain-containing protein n=1 Tax=Fuscovulum blasticum DSM 2131 TaxID=1188250 RepID=A0A2T4J5U1_FUSBL|nr:hypothetical protein C5F44_14950 [Fuscovulum blasticum DSM 2131]